MGSFFLILFLIFLYFVLIRPAYRIWRTMRQMQNRQKDFINSMFGARGVDDPPADPEAEANARARRKGGWSVPKKKRKKIDPEVGEFVKFHETTVTAQATETADGSTTSYAVEEQIIDVSWEDLPPEK